MGDNILVMKNARKQTQNRAMIFIDGNNLHMGLNDCFNIERIDIEPFCKHLIMDRKLEQIFYVDANYIIPKELEEWKKMLFTRNYRNQQSYFRHIKKIPNLTFRSGYYNNFKGTLVEKKSDVHLATELLSNYYEDNFDTAYIIAGDADYAPAIQRIMKSEQSKNRPKKKIINVYFHHEVTVNSEKILVRHSNGIREHCSCFVKITRQKAINFEWRHIKKPQSPKTLRKP